MGGAGERNRKKITKGLFLEAAKILKQTLQTLWNTWHYENDTGGCIRRVRMPWREKHDFHPIPPAPCTAKHKSVFNQYLLNIISEWDHLGACCIEVQISHHSAVYTSSKRVQVTFKEKDNGGRRKEHWELKSWQYRQKQRVRDIEMGGWGHLR